MPSSGIMRPVFQVGLARPVELSPVEVDTVFLARGLEYAHALGHDFLANAVARDDCDFDGLVHFFKKRALGPICWFG